MICVVFILDQLFYLLLILWVTQMDIASIISFISLKSHVGLTICNPLNCRSFWLDMDDGTSTGGRGRGSGKKSVLGSRRVWSTREEKVLIQAFKDIASQGWKSDNGFRTGFLTKLEEATRKEFLQIDIIAHPNITSKMTTWKKHYGSIVTAHLTTGVGFNCTTNQLEVNDDQWIEVVKVIRLPLLLITMNMVYV